MNDAPAQVPEPPQIQRTFPTLLEEKYPRDRYALFFDVPDNVGLKANRRADAIAVGLWGSVGHLIDGFEFKATRSDWLREVKLVDKADPFIARCDRWWLVTWDKDIAKPEEIPECWGWMAATKGGLRVQRPAPRLPQPADGSLQRLFVIGILRKLQEYRTMSPELQREIERVRAEAAASIDRRVEQRLAHHRVDGQRALERVAAFEKDIGMKLEDWHCADVAKIAIELQKMRYGADSLRVVDDELAKQETTLGHMLECLKLARAQITNGGKS